ncbi:hypothetical protein QF001_003142 [Paraburkholderia youngii]
MMKKSKSLYHGQRFPAGVISCAVRWYFRFELSLRDIEELLFERGVIVTYETIRCWFDKFGKGFAHRVKAARHKPGSTWHLDEMFVTLRGEPYLHDGRLTSTAPSSTTPIMRPPPSGCVTDKRYINRATSPPSSAASTDE